MSRRCSHNLFMFKMECDKFTHRPKWESHTFTREFFHFIKNNEKCLSENIPDISNYYENDPVVTAYFNKLPNTRDSRGILKSENILGDKNEGLLVYPIQNWSFDDFINELNTKTASRYEWIQGIETGRVEDTFVIDGTRQSIVNQKTSSNIIYEFELDNTTDNIINFFCEADIVDQGIPRLKSYRVVNFKVFNSRLENWDNIGGVISKDFSKKHEISFNFTRLGERGYINLVNNKKTVKIKIWASEDVLFSVNRLLLEYKKFTTNTKIQHSESIFDVPERDDLFLVYSKVQLYNRLYFDIQIRNRQTGKVVYRYMDYTYSSIPAFSIPNFTPYCYFEADIITIGFLFDELTKTLDGDDIIDNINFRVLEKTSNINGDDVTYKEHFIENREFEVPVDYVANGNHNGYDSSIVTFGDGWLERGRGEYIYLKCTITNLPIVEKKYSVYDVIGDVSQRYLNNNISLNGNEYLFIITNKTLRFNFKKPYLGFYDLIDMDFLFSHLNINNLFYTRYWTGVPDTIFTRTGFTIDMPGNPFDGCYLMEPIDNARGYASLGGDSKITSLHNMAESYNNNYRLLKLSLLWFSTYPSVFFNYITGPGQYYLMIDMNKISADESVIKIYQQYPKRRLPSCDIPAIYEDREINIGRDSSSYFIYSNQDGVSTIIDNNLKPYQVYPYFRPDPDLPTVGYRYKSSEDALRNTVPGLIEEVQLPLLKKYTVNGITTVIDSNYTISHVSPEQSDDFGINTETKRLTAGLNFHGYINDIPFYRVNYGRDNYLLYNDSVLLIGQYLSSIRVQNDGVIISTRRFEDTLIAEYDSISANVTFSV